jgi:hypothetical protein
MKNVFFPEEDISQDDVFFICYMVERVSRHLKRRNRYVINSIGDTELAKLLSLAGVLHCENPLQVENEWIDRFSLQAGTDDVTDVNKELVDEIPSALQMGKVYQRLIFDTLEPDEDYSTAIIRVYNNALCDVIDNYNGSAYYEPSYIIARAYYAGGF